MATQTRDAKFQVSKIEAAKRQLNLAIELWFLDKDPISVQTLAAAAYQIIFDINERRGNTHPKLFDAQIVKPEYRDAWNRMVRSPANFFKHADKDPDGIFEFVPFGNLMFLMFAVSGLGVLEERSSDEERVLHMWLHFHEPNLIVADFKVEAVLKESVPVEHAAELRKLSKEQFFQTSMNALADLRAKGLHK